MTSANVELVVHPNEGFTRSSNTMINTSRGNIRLTIRWMCTMKSFKTIQQNSYRQSTRASWRSGFSKVSMRSYMHERPHKPKAQVTCISR